MARESSRFNEAVKVILTQEGSYVNDPADRGGETKYGISKRSYPELDIKHLTLAQAKAIYRKDYWELHHYDAITHDEVAIKIFDMAVNMGAPWSHRLVQRALRALGQEVKEDGDLGPITLAAINQADSEQLLAALRSEAAGYYRSLVAIRPSQLRFLNGWLKRAYTV